ncbi:ABC transporter substrate-binding protein [Streptomyces sp. LX-29]|uniref:ABC transporter substrate-binding protein n=1 Tax=Streptomyces sp. LX-29 TaxID=2900152 RepID=UPI00240E48F4|nr:ABC transporter substrate-binding protein [Streptomyces sp. LX-29]WFB10418.1 ABC transporter substrate-binding protein [Streptomyces sp. LX-29]
MRKRDPWLAAPLGAGLAAALLTGCGAEGSDSAGGGDRVVMGMSDDVQATDPASGYDPGSWLLFNNVFQSLMSFPKGGSSPQPEAAEKCGFGSNDSTVYTCTLRDGLKFSNGNPLTSKDVKFSFERTLRINDENGPAVMLAGIKSIETPDEKTVTFKLRTPDATFPQKIASGAGSIVDHTEYAADKLRTDNKAVGSGPYKLDSFDEDEATFSVNGDYQGPAGEAQNSGVTLKFFHGKQAELKSAVTDGDVDVAYRGLAMKDLAEIQNASAGSSSSEVKVVEGNGAEVQHLVFNLKHPVAGKLGVRQAIAHLVDRGSLVRDAYNRTVEPLYSIVPAGITGHNTAFYDKYGDQPNREKAKAALDSAGINGKVKLTLWGTPTRYGPGALTGLKLIAKQLNSSGLFEVDVRSADLEAYAKGMEKGTYGVYLVGWVPDYPDPDNFVLPFFGKENVLKNHFSSAAIDRLIPATAAQPSRTATITDFEKIQNVVAEQVPMLPLWQGKQYAVASSEVNGLQWTLDASTVFRFWEVKKGS